jgi:hypothetical protein
MNNARANWIDTFSSFVQFYPKLTAAIAFGTMAAAGRMVSGRNAAVGETISDHAAHFTPPLSHKRTVKKTAKRKTAKRKLARH